MAARVQILQPSDLVTHLRLKDLLFLQKIAECMSLTDAAAELAVTQPAASRWLRELEQLFHAHLFTRDRMAGMTPTPIGEIVLKRARALLSDASSLSSEVDAYRNGRGGFLQLGVIPYVSARLLERVVSTLIGEHAMTVSVIEAATAPLMESLRLQGLHAVIGRCTVQPLAADLRQEVLFMQKACLVVNHAQGPARSTVRFAALAHCHWVMPPRNSPTWQAIVTALASAKLPIPEAFVETASTKLVHSLVSTTRDMVAVVPREIGLDLERLGGVHVLPFPAPFKMPPVGLFAHARNWQGSQMVALRKTLRAVVATGCVLE
jgi:DNA-binding transcriptional LysR family regulator